ncbi:MAG TPA: ATP-binding protein, partial [Thermoanaerobaculia bacterium]
VLHAGTAVLGMFFGLARSLRSISAVGTAMRAGGRTYQEQQDVARAAETVAAVDKQLADLNAELETEVDHLQERFDPEAGELEVLGIKPRKADVAVRFLTLAWAPKRADGDQLKPAWK